MKKVFTGFVIASFIIYIYTLYFMLFAWFNRAPVLMSAHMRLNYSFNLIPLKTIIEYVKALFDGSGHALWNLTGNLFLLLPLGFYLPFLVQKAAKIKIYAVVTAVFILVIETAQLLTYTGSFDVDDFILNFIGALIGFYFLSVNLCVLFLNFVLGKGFSVIGHCRM